jgi:hypothetical protein
MIMRLQQYLVSPKLVMLSASGCPASCKAINFFHLFPITLPQVKHRTGMIMLREEVAGTHEASLRTELYLEFSYGARLTRSAAPLLLGSKEVMNKSLKIKTPNNEPPRLCKVMERRQTA